LVIWAPDWVHIGNAGFKWAFELHLGGLGGLRVLRDYWFLDFGVCVWESFISGLVINLYHYLFFSLLDTWEYLFFPQGFKAIV
jgi:hypothetical protein